MNSERPEFVIDGTKISDRQSFYDEIGGVLLPGVPWGKNLDALNDILAGGFGTPENGFTLRWKNADSSEVALAEDFPLIVEIIRAHGPEGDYANSRVQLVLD